MLTWPELLASALVGTDRRMPEGLAAADAPGALLDAAAVLAVTRRAGYRPVTGVPAPDAAPPDPAPAAGPPAAERLTRLLDTTVFDPDTRAELLVEWLVTAADRGVRVPGELLPALLDLGRRRRELRPLVVAAGGARAGWLAAQHPDWAYLIGERDDAAAADPSRWELGTTGQRAGYLAAVRRTDPAGARDLLAAAWAGETPEDRATLLAVLGTGLSTADEAFLEAALDDRRREVRAVALDLLGRLPGSAYQARMVARARAGLRRERGMLVVVPPEACDREMRRDGIAPRPPAGVGERAWWLEEILARTPLSVWGEPARFLALRVAGGWLDVVLRGLARATTVSQDPAWAAALVDALLASPGAHDRPDDLLLVESLYTALPPAERVARAVEALRREGAGRTAPGVDHLLELCPRPWPQPLADAVFAALDRYVQRSAPSWRVTELCQLAAVRLPATVADRAATFAGSIPERDASVRRAAGALADVLGFRHDMLEELR
jgi:Family of unknown function (DUF5691)